MNSSEVHIYKAGDGVSPCELNQRIDWIKKTLFGGLWHDRTSFNPLKYTNLPDLYNTSRREEWVETINLVSDNRTRNRPNIVLLK